MVVLLHHLGPAILGRLLDPGHADGEAEEEVVLELAPHTAGPLGVQRLARPPAEGLPESHHGLYQTHSSHLAKPTLNIIIIKVHPFINSIQCFVRPAH